jgi:hypothetical protein
LKKHFYPIRRTDPAFRNDEVARLFPRFPQFAEERLTSC